MTRDAGRDTLIMSSGCTNLFLILTWIQFTLRRLLSKCSTVSSRCPLRKSSRAWQPCYQDGNWCYCQHVPACVQTAAGVPGTWACYIVNCSDILISYSHCTHSCLCFVYLKLYLLCISCLRKIVTGISCVISFVDKISRKSRQCNI